MKLLALTFAVSSVAVSSVAFAQVARPLGETPFDPSPAYKTYETASPNGPEGRFSAFSKGQGGPLFAFSQIVDGLLVGGVIGFGLSGQATAYSIPLGTYLGALTGGVALGSLGVLVQYYQRIGLVGAGAATLGLGVGALAGFGLAQLLSSSIEGLPSLLPGILALAGSQVGAFVPLALSWAADDLSSASLVMMAAGALHALGLTALVTLGAGLSLNAAALLIAPAAGMAVGGLFAAFLEPKTSSVFLQTAPALGVGLAAFFIASMAFSTPQGPAIIALGATAATVGITAIAAAATPVSTTTPIEVTPSISIAPPSGLAPSVALPALAGRF